MEYRQIEALYHLTAIANLLSIFERGLLCHERANRERRCAQDISDREVQSIRANKEIAPNRRLHSYVPLFLNPRNAMLYRCKRAHGVDALALLACDSGAIFWRETMATDRNAARADARVGPAREMVRSLSVDDVFRRSWDSQEELGTRMQAEVLVYDRLGQAKINRIIVANERVRRRVGQQFDGRPCPEISVNGDLFFE